jgi:hypothetical protein
MGGDEEYVIENKLVSPSQADAIGRAIDAELPPRTWWCVSHSEVFLEKRRSELQHFVDKGLLRHGRDVYELSCVRRFFGVDGLYN